MKIRHSLLTALIAFGSMNAMADMRGEIAAHQAFAGSNLLAYPDRDLPNLTDAPGGYEPFHIEHYGRHGSRWLLSEGDYNRPLHLLDSAAVNGALTAQGEKLRNEISEISADAYENYGRLTPLGAEQHRGIARRMVSNFPEVFAGEGNINATSTTVVRCILSMANELVEIAAANPGLKITTEAGKPLQKFLNPNDYDTVAIEIKRAVRPRLREYQKGKVNPMRMAGAVIDTLKMKVDSGTARTFFTDLFEIALNEQSHGRPLLTDAFTADEIYGQWEANNAKWYVNSGFSPVTSRRMPQMVNRLVEQIVTGGDEAIAAGGNGANLRFGHETVLLPLACALHLNGMDVEIENLDSIADHWQAYKAFPMGGNVQVVFYRNASKPVLVKVLLNEHESKLPLPAENEVYYKWEDVKRLWKL